MRDELMETIKRSGTLFGLAVGTLLISAVVATASLTLLLLSPLGYLIFWRSKTETNR